MIQDVIDIKKQVDYWRKGAEEDLELAEEIVEKGKFRQGLFFAHLAIEKFLKGLVAKETKSIPPKIHNLLRLSEIAKLEVAPERSATLGELNELCIEGRYAEPNGVSYDREAAEEFMEEVQEIAEWLRKLY
jgi:HEPN domain-containing protein